MKRDPDELNLRDAFGAMPAEMHDALMRTARSVKEEEPVKKRISAALVLAIALGLAVIGTAYALFSSQVADFFGLHWNAELGERLQQGMRSYTRIVRCTVSARRGRSIPRMCSCRMISPMIPSISP